MKISHLVMLLALGTSFSVFAQQTTTSTTSRANDNLESEGNTNFEWIEEGGVFAHGNLATNHQVLFRDGQSQHGVQVDLETRLFEICDNQSGYYGDQFGILAAGEECGDEDGRDLGMLLFPFEMTMRFNVDMANDVDIQKVRQGVVRLIVGDSGFSAQFASYLQTQYQISDSAAQDVIFRGAEIVNIGVNRSFDVDSDGKVQIMVRIQGGVAVGQVRSSNIDAASLAGETDVTTGSSRVGVLTSASGTLGVRILGRVLVEAFGGTDFIRADNSFVHMNNFYYGGQIRAGLIRNRLDLTLRAQRNIMPDIGVIPANQSTTVTTGLQVHW